MAAPAPAPTVVIVDPMGSGSYLAPLFAKQGWNSVAVLTSSTLNPALMATVHPDDHLEVLNAQRGLEPVLTRLRALAQSGSEIVAVVPGTETGVELADTLADFLGTPGNGTEQSRSRRDKAAQGERLHLCGVPAAAQVVATEESTLVDWATGLGRWPVVVKPTQSAGSDGVSLCANADQVREAFRRIIGQTNKLGGRNESVLGQEFLDGQQYLVNSVSVQGQHYVGEIWRFDSTFEDGHQIYDKQELLEPHGPLQDTLVAYVMRVLDALQVRHGAAHTEVMLTGAGPRLIECAARMTGLIGQSALMGAVGHHHISLTVECESAPAEIVARMPRYRLGKAVQIVALKSPVDGRLHDGAALRQLLALPTFAECAGGSLRPGTPVHRTVDLFTTPGLVYLLGDTRADVERDAAVIRHLEATGDLYAGDTASASLVSGEPC